VHPRWLLEPDDLALVDLWREWRGVELVLPMPSPAGGAQPVAAGRLPGRLPFAGGLADQPACVIEAFREMDRALVLLKERA